MLLVKVTSKQTTILVFNRGYAKLRKDQVQPQNMQTGYSLRGKQIDIPTYRRSKVMPQRKNIKAEI